MIIGIGTDLCDIKRIAAVIERFGPRFLHRVYTEQECALCPYLDRHSQLFAAYFAKRWAAKEACAKALGCGLPGPDAMREIEVTRQTNSRPILNVTGAMAVYLTNTAPEGARLHLSLTDDGDWAQAFVVIEAV